MQYALFTRRGGLRDSDKRDRERRRQPELSGLRHQPPAHTADPRVVPEARRLAEIGCEEMQELAEAGAKVLNAQAVEVAKEKGIAIYARATRGGGETIVRRHPPRLPGRVVGVASEAGLVVVTTADDGPALCSRTSSWRTPCARCIGSWSRKETRSMTGARSPLVVLLTRASAACPSCGQDANC